MTDNMKDNSDVLEYCRQASPTQSPDTLMASSFSYSSPKPFCSFSYDEPSFSTDDLRPLQRYSFSLSSSTTSKSTPPLSTSLSHLTDTLPNHSIHDSNDESEDHLPTPPTPNLSLKLNTVRRCPSVV
jgi:hypothetical protein